MEINPLKPPEMALPSMGQAVPAAAEGPVSFKALLADALTQVNNLQQNADAASAKFAAGESIAIDEVMLAVQKADLALQLTQQIRNKLVDAYQEISRMQV
jgi:flagellar hook-basal body complex protein FliE